jgi:putative lipoic acid-binding regulatory protein
MPGSDSPSGGPAGGSPRAIPTPFPIKVMGRKGPGFAQAVVDIVLKHAPVFDAATVEMRPSRQGNYLSVTCVVRATSRHQLDALYQELCDHPSVVMAL